LDVHDAWLMAVVFVLALILRGIYLQEIQRLPEFDQPPVDAGYHDYWAWGLASGEWSTKPGRENPGIPSTPFFRPPLCPYFLAAVYRILGHSYVGVRVVQTVLGSFGCVLAYLLARRVFSRSAAVLAGLLMAGYWALIYFDTELREVVLLVPLHLLLLLGLVWLRRRPSYWLAAVCGLMLGLAALARPNAALFLPVGMAWTGLALRRPLRRRRNLILNACLLGGALAAIAPATLRNAVVAHDFVPICSNGGINLYIANNPRATGCGVLLPSPLPEFASAFDYPRLVRYAERVEGRAMKHSEVSRYFTGLALAHVAQHPGRTVGLVLKKAVLFWGGLEIASEQDLNAARAESPLLRNLPGGFASLFGVAAVGVVLAVWPRRAAASVSSGPRGELQQAAANPDRTDAGLILLFVATYFVSFLPFFVTDRYRVPIIPLLIVFAAHGVARLAGWLGQRRLVRPVAAAAVMVGLWAAVRVDYFHVADDGFKAAYDRAHSYADKGLIDQAVAGYERALSIRPDDPKAHNNLGILLADSGRRQEAIAHYEQALRASPDYPEANNNLALELMNTGRLDEALLHFWETVRLDPDFALAHKNLGLALALLDRDDEAMHHYREALRLLPNDSGAHYNLAVLLERQGRLAEAVEEYREASRLDPIDGRIRAALKQALDELAEQPPQRP